MENIAPDESLATVSCVSNSVLMPVPGLCLSCYHIPINTHGLIRDHLLREALQNTGAARFGKLFRKPGVFHQ
jgi:hypothetical protein